MALTELSSNSDSQTYGMITINHSVKTFKNSNGEILDYESKDFEVKIPEQEEIYFRREFSRANDIPTNLVLDIKGLDNFKDIYEEANKNPDEFENAEEIIDNYNQLQEMIKEELLSDNFKDIFDEADYDMDAEVASKILNGNITSFVIDTNMFGDYNVFIEDNGLRSYTSSYYLEQEGSSNQEDYLKQKGFKEVGLEEENLGKEEKSKEEDFDLEL